MVIDNIDLTKTNFSQCEHLVNQCKEIINENLQARGGLLKISNIFERDLNWTNLIVAILEGKVVGFALIRLGNSEHGLRGEYYYLSDIVVSNKHRHKGVGTALMKSVLSCTKKMPLVASCLIENRISTKLLSKYMTCYGLSNRGKYLRFVDNKTYNKLHYRAATYSPSADEVHTFPKHK